MVFLAVFFSKIRQKKRKMLQLGTVTIINILGRINLLIGVEGNKPGNTGIGR